MSLTNVARHCSMFDVPRPVQSSASSSACLTSAIASYDSGCGVSPQSVARASRPAHSHLEDQSSADACACATTHAIATSGMYFLKSCRIKIRYTCTLTRNCQSTLVLSSASLSQGPWDSSRPSLIHVPPLYLASGPTPRGASSHPACPWPSGSSPRSPASFRSSGCDTSAAPRSARELYAFHCTRFVRVCALIFPCSSRSSSSTASSEIKKNHRWTRMNTDYQRAIERSPKRGAGFLRRS